MTILDKNILPGEEGNFLKADNTSFRWETIMHGFIGGLALSLRVIYLLLLFIITFCSEEEVVFVLGVEWSGGEVEDQRSGGAEERRR